MSINLSGATRTYESTMRLLELSSNKAKDCIANTQGTQGALHLYLQTERAFLKVFPADVLDSALTITDPANKLSSPSIGAYSLGVKTSRNALAIACSNLERAVTQLCVVSNGIDGKSEAAALIEALVQRNAPSNAGRYSKVKTHLAYTLEGRSSLSALASIESSKIYLESMLPVDYMQEDPKVAVPNEKHGSIIGMTHVFNDSMTLLRSTVSTSYQLVAEYSELLDVELISSATQAVDTSLDLIHASIMSHAESKYISMARSASLAIAVTIAAAYIRMICELTLSVFQLNPIDLETMPDSEHFAPILRFWSVSEEFDMDDIPCAVLTTDDFWHEGMEALISYHCTVPCQHTERKVDARATVASAAEEPKQPAKKTKRVARD